MDVNDTSQVPNVKEDVDIFIFNEVESGSILICKTENELKEAWRPSDFEYETRVPGDILILTVVLCYSFIAPIIIPFGALYFGIGWLVLRNQALKVYFPTYESHGRFWPHMQVRILTSLILYQVTMLGFFGVKKFYYGPFLFQDTALEVAAHELKENPNMEQIYKSYIDPTKPEL